ncbi:hypothetical protein CAter282_3136 [Collimonas arenae]|uniref:DUF1854 domain-containing protein n=1 Tax=Collimonas arenae TaxID=279058 RepID=A0A127QL97_9BURK|nr:DUF1854 domain-containing protein [Collimonas arenae]AMP00949.1 hypothetical protein CAter10_3440 [Collimonas arenae]AMP10843.1 hypothetical protein CAter282_3136 [Collimonas arenae]
MTTHDFTLSRNAFGKLVFTAANGDRFEGVVPVRAFPIGAPDDGIALVNADGQELAWIMRLSDLADDTRAMVEQELASREFMPEIQRIQRVSNYNAPCTWFVETNRGDASFTLKGEEDIRRIASTSLLIADNHGVQFLIRDTQALDKGSRKILDRFL